MYKFFTASLSKKIFDKIFEIKADAVQPVLDNFNVEKEELKNLLWEEFNIPGMEVRIANTALDWLIMNCEEDNDLGKTLKSEIRKDILYAGIFYTNVAPDCINARNWKPK